MSWLPKLPPLPTFDWTLFRLPPIPMPDFSNLLSMWAVRRVSSGLIDLPDDPRIQPKLSPSIPQETPSSLPDETPPRTERTYPMTTTPSTTPSLLDSIMDTAKTDTIEGVKRAGVIQVVKTLKLALATAIAKGQGRATKKRVAENMAFLNSDLGDAVFKIAIGALLPAFPAQLLGPLAPYRERLCRELRVQGTAQVVVMGADLLLEPMRQAMLGLVADETLLHALASLPAGEAPSLGEPAPAATVGASATGVADTPAAR
jgi:hypothetical protein